MLSPFVPKIVSCFREGYSRKQFSQDLMAGLIVGIVALPLAIAFGIASGVKPEQGLFTAIVAGFLISALGGSRVQIGGPTGAFIVVVFAIVAKHGYAGLAVATIMAGMILVLMGLTRMGAVIKFIPYPMTVGFTSGIALIIAATQIKDLLGLSIPQPQAEFIAKLGTYSAHWNSLNPWALAVGLGSLTVMLGWGKITRRIPGSIVAIVLGTLAVHFFDLPVATIGSEFGEVPSSLPAPSLPEFNWQMVPVLIGPALTIAMLGAIESLLSAVVADGMTGRRHRSNMELVAQGVANIVTPLFGGIPATGAIARTATNVKNGGQTPVAGIIHAATILIILMFFGHWATLIPMACLAAVLLVVAYHMSEWRHFVGLLRSPREDILVMLATFLLTVFVDLTMAIEVGIVLSALLFMNRMARVTEIKNITEELQEDYEDDDNLSIRTRHIPKGIEVFEINGPFFFGAANHFKDTMTITGKPPKVLILRMRHVMSIDATAMRALEDIIIKINRQGTTLILSGVTPVLRGMLEKNGFRARLAGVSIYPDIDSALAAGQQILGETEPEATASS